MDPTDVIAKIPTGGDPILDAVKWLAVLIVLVLLSAAPFMAWMRKMKKDSSDSAKDDASITLYEQLQAQIKQNGDDIRELMVEKNRYFEEALTLRQKVAEYVARQKDFDQALLLIEKLRTKLDEKDAKILLRETENLKIINDMAEIKDQIHRIEFRLASERPG